MASSNDCNADDPVVIETQQNFLSDNVTFTESNTETIYGQSQNGFASDGNSSSMVAHEVFNGALSTAEGDENDDQDSTISSMSWVHRQMTSGVDPRLILGELLPKGTCIPFNVNNSLLWRLVVNLISEPKRTKLSHINTLDDAVNLLRTCQNIIVLTGAGVSVSCGIPDFRSKDGIYARLKKDYPALPDPQAMFDIQYFRRDPRPFFKFAKEIYPGQFKPSASHHFIRVLEKQNKLLRNYTQNIDTLEHAAGIKNVITCHGSFATATCTLCGYKVDSSVIKEDIFQQRIPYCPICPAELGERGIMKPDIVFFGEGLSDEFHEAMAHDKEICDLLIVMGSSLKVRPVAMIPSSIPTNVPQILINREPLEHLTFDIELLGDCDVIIGELCRRLENEWEIDENIPRFSLKEITVQSSLKLETDPQSSEVNNNHNSEQHNCSQTFSQNDESNSCDCRGMSAIKLDDSEDCSNQEQSIPSSAAAAAAEALSKEDIVDDKSLWPVNSDESLSKRIPDQSYLFFPPCRYVFTGAEVYKENNVDDDDDDCCSTPTDYSSDCDSPLIPPLSNTTDVNCTENSELQAQSSNCEKEEPKEKPNT